MAFPVAAGSPNYSGNFIPEIWSGKLVVNFYDMSFYQAVDQIFITVLNIGLEISFILMWFATSSPAIRVTIS